MTARDWRELVARRLPRLGVEPGREAEIREELAQQLEASYVEALERGADAAAAREQAERQVPDWPALAAAIMAAETPRAARSARPVPAILGGDARYGLRLLGRRPGFAALTILTLALGIGANTAVFSAIRAVFVRPLPYAEPERLVHLWASWPGGFGNMSYPDYEALRAEATSFDGLAAYECWGNLALTGLASPIVLKPSFVTPTYFELLGARPLLGRLFRADEGVTPGGPPLAVLSHALWQRQFGGAPGIVGRTVELNRTPITVVGVLPPDFRDLGLVESAHAIDLWLPITMAQPLLGQPPLSDGYSIYWGLGRLKPGVTIEQARQDVAAVAERLARTRPDTNRGRKLEAQTLVRRTRGAFAGPTLLLTGGAAFILLIGCLNVSNLLLGRLVERRPEFALRAALGASARRLVAQTLVESGLLAAAGGALGLVFAAGVTRLLAAWIHANVSPFLDVRTDLGVLTVSLGLSLATVLLFGLPVALAATRVDLRQAIESGRRLDGPSGHAGLRRILVVAEVAFCAMLLVGAGLMLRSFEQLTRGGLGFRTDRLLTFRMDLTDARYAEPEARVRFVEEFLEKAKAIPGVESATIWGPSMLGNATWIMNVAPEERDDPRPESFTMVFRNSVNPGGLAHLGVPLLRGRDFAPADTAAKPAVGIISRSVADELWPNQDPVGKRMRRDNPSLPPITVIGVAADAIQRQRYSLGDIADGLGPIGAGPQRDLYLPYAQRPNRDVTAGVRVNGEPAGVVAGLRGLMATLDTALPLADVRMLDDRLADQDVAPAALTALMAAYAGLALVLALVGIYGVVGQAVSRRTREIGLRLALGARGGDVLRLVFRQGLAAALSGLAAGLAGALLLGRIMRSLLFGVAPTDPLTFAGVALLLLLVAGAAIYVPARRATRVDPLLALRHE